MTRCGRSSTCWSASVVFALLVAATAASAQTAPDSPPDKAQVAAAAPPEGKAVQMGPTREIKLAENTWLRFGVQVQAWFKAAGDRIRQPDGSDGGMAFDFTCRRCRLFVTGSVVKNITFNFMLEGSNLGKANADGTKTTIGAQGLENFNAPQILDAYAQIKFADAFQLSAGNILMPLTRNGTQPTTTYLSIDNANVATVPAAQGNTYVLRDLGFQVNGFVLGDMLEYRVGAFQGSRAPAIATATAGHNPPRFVVSLQGNLWDPEKGYVNGGHYFGTKKVLGAFASFDYQTLRTGDPLPGGSGAGTAKGAYSGIDAAVFVNYPLSGSADKAGGDEIVGLLEFALHDGGGSLPGATPVALATYPNVLKQSSLLAEAAYFNKGLQMSFFGKYEMKTIDSSYTDAQKAAQNVAWLAFGLKYYFAPGNLFNVGLQYERIMWGDALPVVNPTTQANNPVGLTPSATNNVTLQVQMILY